MIARFKGVFVHSENRGPKTEYPLKETQNLDHVSDDIDSDTINNAHPVILVRTEDSAHGSGLLLNAKPDIG